MGLRWLIKLSLQIQPESFCLMAVHATSAPLRFREIKAGEVQECRNSRGATRADVPAQGPAAARQGPPALGSDLQQPTREEAQELEGSDAVPEMDSKAQHLKGFAWAPAATGLKELCGGERRNYME